MSQVRIGGLLRIIVMGLATLTPSLHSTDARIDRYACRKL